MSDTPRLGEVLVDAKLISNQQLQQVQRAAQRSGSPLVAMLVGQGLVGEDALVDALCRRLDLEIFDPARSEVETDAVRAIAHEQASRFCLLPLRLVTRDGRSVLRVAMADPLDRQAIEEIEYSTGHAVEPLIAGLSQITDAIRSHYRHVVTQVIPRQATGELRTPVERKRTPFGGSLDEADLRTRPMQRAQQAASPAQRVAALVALLVRKGVIDQDEYEEQLRSIVRPGKPPR